MQGSACPPFWGERPKRPSPSQFLILLATVPGAIGLLKYLSLWRLFRNLFDMQEVWGASAAAPPQGHLSSPLTSFQKHGGRKQQPVTEQANVFPPSLLPRPKGFLGDLFQRQQARSPLQKAPLGGICVFPGKVGGGSELKAGAWVTRTVLAGSSSFAGCFSKDQVYLEGILQILRHRQKIDFRLLAALGKVRGPHLLFSLAAETDGGQGGRAGRGKPWISHFTIAESFAFEWKGATFPPENYVA